MAASATGVWFNIGHWSLVYHRPQFSLLTHKTAQVAASATGAVSQCMMPPPTARLAEDRRRRETRRFWREMPKKWRERAARMPPQPRITDSLYSAWRAEVGRLFTWPVFSRYMYVHTCYVLTNPPIPSSRCKCFVVIRPV